MLQLPQLKSAMLFHSHLEYLKVLLDLLGRLDLLVRLVQLDQQARPVLLDQRAQPQLP